MRYRDLSEARSQFDELRRNLAAIDRRPSVLLVEDDGNDATLVKKKLQPFHLSMELAKTSLEAIEQLKLRAFDITFLDLRLESPASGLDVLRYARNQSINTIFIVLTGVDDHNPLIKEALEEGAKFVIQKPITAEHLQVIFGSIT